MALTAGTRLGPYEILAPLGAGGMGEVYRARDTRLDRTVAVKVLPGDLAADPEAKARFEREARAISALAHPNICTLHDVGEEDGRTFLVMEHLVGQTLAERLKKGALPLEQALEVATQIAEALAAAHRQGIVHRDLKPANVMLTKTGARLLDFGLARLTAHGEQPAVESLTSAPTEAEPLTGAGTVMGTLPYMAPEQVEGKPADARTDIWALGLILYEMLRGRRAFEASTPTSLAGAILEREPAPLQDGQPLTPPSLERLVRRCLAKDPDERWDGAHDVAVLLREIAQAYAEPKAARTFPRWAVPGLVAAVVTALLVGVLGPRLWQGAPEGPVIRSEIDLTPDKALTIRHPTRTMVALSPDGTLLSWAGSPDGTFGESALYLRRLDTGKVTRLPGTEGGSQPFFSPDGHWIGFWAGDEYGEGKLRKVAVDGGLAVDLAELSSFPMGASWATDGKIYLGSETKGIQWVPADGGPAQEVTTVDPTREAGHRLPSILPGDRAFLFTTMPGMFGVKARIEAFSPATGERKVLVEDGAHPRYLETGHLAFVRHGVLMAAPFDVSRLELAATPTPVVESVSQALNIGISWSNSGAGQYTVSDSGLLVYAPGDMKRDAPFELFLLNEAGGSEPFPGFDKPTLTPQFHFSPDGRQLVFAEKAPDGLLWLFDLERQTYRPLSNSGIAGSPRWSPDGTRVVMGWTESGRTHLWMVATARGDRERLTQGEDYGGAPSWSPDGRFLAFVRAHSEDIALYGFEDRQVVPFLTTKAKETYPEFSPDGHWLAYVSDESGRDEVYVTSFPDKERTLSVSRRGGRAPAWSRDGRRLFYYSHPPADDGRRSMMAVSVHHAPELSLGRPTALFRLPERFVDLAPMRSYDLHPDGQRFLVAVAREQEPVPPITRLHVVHNWFEELKRLVPTD